MHLTSFNLRACLGAICGFLEICHVRLPWNEEERWMWYPGWHRCALHCYCDRGPRLSVGRVRSRFPPPPPLQNSGSPSLIDKGSEVAFEKSMCRHPDVPDVQVMGHKLGLESQAMDLHPFPSQLPFWLLTLVHNLTHLPQTHLQAQSFLTPLETRSVSGEADGEGRLDQWKDNALSALCELVLWGVTVGMLKTGYAWSMLCCQGLPPYT